MQIPKSPVGCTPIVTVAEKKLIVSVAMMYADCCCVSVCIVNCCALSTGMSAIFGAVSADF